MVSIYASMSVALLSLFLLVAATTAAVPSSSSVPTTAAPPVTHSIHAHLHTNYGVITFELLPDVAPKSVANFVNLSTTGFYNHTYFYRLEKGFVLQGGGYYANQTSNVTVPLEYHLPNTNWTVGLARAYEEPDSGSSEYFINLGNNTAALAPGGSSKHGYAVFAMVVGGFDTIHTLLGLPTHFSNQDGMTEFDKPWPIVEHIQIVQY